MEATPSRPFIGFGSLFLAFAGIGLLIVGLMATPDAYAYRQRTGEGHSLAFPGFLMGLGVVVACVAAGLMFRTAHKAAGLDRTIAAIAGGCVIAALVAGMIVGFYVESRYTSPMRP